MQRYSELVSYRFSQLPETEKQLQTRTLTTAVDNIIKIKKFERCSYTVVTGESIFCTLDIIDGGICG